MTPPPPQRRRSVVGLATCSLEAGCLGRACQSSALLTSCGVPRFQSGKRCITDITHKHPPLDRTAGPRATWCESSRIRSNRSQACRRRATAPPSLCSTRMRDPGWLVGPPEEKERRTVRHRKRIPACDRRGTIEHFETEKRKGKGKARPPHNTGWIDVEPE